MKKVAWLLIDDRKGSAGQIRGVGMYLADKGYQIIEKRLNIPLFQLCLTALGGARSSVSANHQKPV